jgi:hypothetical protein
MADHDADHPERPTRKSRPPFGDAPDTRSHFERIVPELLKRGLEAGKDTLESVVPRDVAAAMAAQLGDVRSGVVRAVAQEVGRFLHEADIAKEVRKVLIGLDIEATVQLRFNAREDGGLSVKLSDAKAQRPSARRRGVFQRSDAPPPPVAGGEDDDPLDPDE